MSKTYWEKLQDPRWQKKRLEVMKEKDFHCEICGTNEITLNVHHKEYFKGNEPWEYDNKQLVVLCKHCHEDLHETLDLYKWVGSFARLDGPDNRQELAIMLCGYIGYPLEKIFDMLGQEFNPVDEIYYKAGFCAKAYSEHLFEERLKELKNAQ